MAERLGRRWAIVIPAALGVPTAFLYLMTQDYTLVVIGFGLQGMFACGGMHAQYPAYPSERFPTEVRATAVAFCFHQGAIWGRTDLTAPRLVCDDASDWVIRSDPCHDDCRPSGFPDRGDAEPRDQGQGSHP